MTTSAAPTPQRLARRLRAPLLAVALAAAALLVVTLLAPRPAAAVDPYLDWHTLETENFLIHYHDGLGELPQQVAVMCEEAHLMMVPFFNWIPEEKTHVVLDDTLDTANGFAGVVPRNRIRIFLYGPTQRSSLGDYDDWLRSLIIHEYAHILHIDTKGLVPDVINTILGKTSAPNQVLPRWYTEGIATYQESTQTSGGRVRSSLFRMYLRTGYLEGTFLSLGDISSNPVDWPGGTVPYLYGSHFLAYVAETRGEAFFHRFHEAYGERIVPYSINTTMREVLGEDFTQLYDEWTAHLAAKFEAELLKVRLEGVTPLEWINRDGELTERPMVRPGRSEVTFYSARPDDYAGIYAHDLKSGETRTLFQTPIGGQSYSWDPTGRFVVYHANRIWRNTYSYNDLVLHDTQTGRARQVTRGLRARDPDFEPTRGREVVFVRNDASRTSLELLDVGTGEREVLVQGRPASGQFDTPRYSPDGRLIAVSYWRRGHGRDVYVWDTRTGRMVQLTWDRAQDQSPSWSPDGRYLLFASDRTGFYDIYALDAGSLQAELDRLGPPDGREVTPDTFARVALPTWRLTRVERGVFAPQVASDGGRDWLYVVAYNSNGFNIARTPYDPARFMPAPASEIERPKTSYPELPDPVLAKEGYAAGSYLAPLSVYPLFAVTNSGRDSYGAELVGFDPVGLHSWSFVGEYFTETETALVLGGYSYSRLPFGVFLNGQYSSYEVPRSLVRESRFVPFKEEAWDGQAQVGFSLGTGLVRSQLSLGYNLRYTRTRDLPETTPEPGDISPQDPTQGNFSSAFISLGTGRTLSYRDSISAEEGYSLQLTLRLRDEAIGSDVRSIEARYSGTGYVPMPWLRNHVVATRVIGGIGRSNFQGRELFPLGGLPPQEVFTSVINDTPLGGTYLRGFEPFTFAGEQFHLVTPSYRMPVVDLNKGFDTLPFYLGRLSLSAYTDIGSTFNGPIGDASWQVGAGAELRLSASLGYSLPVGFRLGYVHGFGSQGIDDVYFFFGNTF